MLWKPLSSISNNSGIAKLFEQMLQFECFLIIGLMTEAILFTCSSLWKHVSSSCMKLNHGILSEILTITNLRHAPSRIMSSGIVEWTFVAVVTTALPQRRQLVQCFLAQLRNVRRFTVLANSVFSCPATIYFYWTLLVFYCQADEWLMSTLYEQLVWI